MDRARLLGSAICALAIAGTFTFLWGINARAYWAIAIPIAVLVVSGMALLFWVGWILFTTGPTSSATHEEARRTGRLLR